MIYAVSVTNPKGETLRLELSSPEKSGLIVKKITGLSPPKADIASGSLVTTDGGIFNSARVESRNIVINLAFMFRPTIEEARLKTYVYFPIKKMITLKIETDRRTSYITGYVEENDVDIFSNAEEAQVSIICVEPWFYEERIDEMVFSGVKPIFEFPFANDSLSQKVLKFGDIRTDNRAEINYRGDVDTGVLIMIHALDIAENITLWNTQTRESMKINTTKIQKITGQAFDMGDDILISTISGSRSARLLRDGKYTNILSAIDREADWFEITPGVNSFTFTAENGENDLQVTFSYRNMYGGV